LNQQEIIIVSGLPRSGTSMMMNMLQGGGIPLLIDEDRPPDSNNPLGYFEFTPAKTTRQDNNWLYQAVGKAVKIVTVHLPYLACHYLYKIIFMERNLDQVLSSQNNMLNSMQNAPSSYEMHRIYSAHLKEVKNWLHSQKNISTLFLDYEKVMAYPEKTVQEISFFLQRPLKEEMMTKRVNPNLCHHPSVV